MVDTLVRDYLVERVETGIDHWVITGYLAQCAPRYHSFRQLHRVSRFLGDRVINAGQACASIYPFASTCVARSGGEWWKEP